MFAKRWSRRLLFHYKRVLLLLFGVVFLIILPIAYNNKHMRHPPCDLPEGLDTLDLDVAAVETSVDEYLVPNYVHFYRFGLSANNVYAVDILCILAAFKNQKPERIFIHSDNVNDTIKSFSDYKYGRKLLTVPGLADTLHFLHYPQPKYIFGIPFSTKYREWHISDIAKLRILRKYGGVFLNNDVYLFKNINELRKNELSLASGTTLALGNELPLASSTTLALDNALLVAHKDSTLLRGWIKSYMHYDPQRAAHHTSPTFLQWISNVHPKPHTVQGGIIRSDVEAFFNDDIPEMQTTSAVVAVDLDVQPRGQLPKLDYISYIDTYGTKLIDRYFELDEFTRKRVNLVNRNLVDHLNP
uniref:Nucleotide-diphospho-sugar transferase domain-containing protein n=1 Tax=Clastoptera arizonana TaxID=38151 RepID=A0A1B6ECW8_9HEMI